MHYTVDYLERLLGAVEAFESTFEEWMLTQDEVDHSKARGLFPTVATKTDADAGTVQRLELRVAEAAGLASRAVPVTGTYIAVAGLGMLDPIENWFHMAQPKAVLSPRELRAVTATVKGRIKALISESANGVTGGQPAFAPSEMHCIIWTAAAAHWTTHQYRVAVREAAEALTAFWRDKLGRHDVDGTTFWQQTLSHGDPSPGCPKLVWPGEESGKNVKSMRNGLPQLVTALNQLATGLNMTVRNTATHSTSELTEQHATERLAAYSYLARVLDSCDIRYATEPDVTSPNR